MENQNKGRNWRAKYLTRDEFHRWVNNDYAHLVQDVKLNRRLLVGILIATVVIPTAFMLCIVQILG